MGFRVTDLNSRDDFRVVANVDGRTDVRVEFCKNVGELWSLILSILNDNALYLYQVLSKYLIGFRVTDLNSRVDARVVTEICKGA